MSSQQQLENLLKASLTNKAERVSPSNNMFENIKYQIQLDRSEKKFMLKDEFLPLKLKKLIATAACSIFLCTALVLAASPEIRAFAAQSIDKFVSGYINVKSYATAPSKDELKKDLGYEVKMPASLPGGYQLINSSIAANIDGSSTAEQYEKKGIAGIYSKNNNKEDSITLSIWNEEANDISNSSIYINAKNVTIGNTPAYWTEYTKHIIPKNIFDTLSSQERDKLYNNEKSGKEVLVIVAAKNGKQLDEKLKTTHSLKWTQDNATYQLTDENNKLSLEEISQLAENILNSK